MLTPPHKVFGAALFGVAITGLLAIGVTPGGWPLILVAAVVGSAVTAGLIRQLEKGAAGAARAQEVANRQHDAERRVLERDRDRLQSILGAMSEGVVLLDQDRRILLANPSARALLSLAPANDPASSDLSPTQRISTELPPTLLDVNRLPGLQDLSDRGLSGERAAVELTLQNGRQVLVRTAPLTGSDSQSAVLVFNEVTDLRHVSKPSGEIWWPTSRTSFAHPSPRFVDTPRPCKRGARLGAGHGRFIGIIHRHAERLLAPARMTSCSSCRASKPGDDLSSGRRSPFDRSSSARSISFGQRQVTAGST